MKKPLVDYREFRFSRLNEPRFSHLKLLGGWIFYFIMYFITENLIPPERHHLVHWFLDDRIPFNEWFLLFYVSWYALIVYCLIVFALYDIRSFKDLQKYIIVTQVVAMIIYILWPSVQDLRPAVFARDNPLTRLMAFIYGFDTPTGVCPSLHVAYTLGICSVWLKKKDASRVWKVVLVIWGALICVSTAFVKQHSTLDILAALPLGALAEYLVFHGFLKEK
ncbi:MAG: phosphatase PAP2 family protein [Oscillospiraceae bacterium]|nr:phosphatase PAP2 family protein [Oscillospiraceae bacterium]